MPRQRSVKEWTHGPEQMQNRIDLDAVAATTQHADPQRVTLARGSLAARECHGASATAAKWARAHIRARLIDAGAVDKARTIGHECTEARPLRDLATRAAGEPKTNVPSHHGHAESSAVLVLGAALPRFPRL